MNNKIIKVIRKIYYLTSCVVPFTPRETICPVCKFLGLTEKNSVKVLKTTSDGFRYCECIKCGSHFRAFAENQDAKLEKVQNLCTKEEKSVKPKAKASETDNVINKPTTRTKRGKRRNKCDTRRCTKLSD